MISVLIDTSEKNLSVGVALDGKIIDRVERDAWQKQSEFLVAELSSLFERNHLEPKKIGEIICSKGPGSYTGVRIAVSVAKVMAFALGVPLYMLSSLEALEHESDPTICLVNARSKRSYIGVYEGKACYLPDTIMSNDEVLAYRQAHPDYRLAGDLSYLGLDSPIPDRLGNLLRLHEERDRVDPLTAKPIYLKDLA